MKKEEAPTPLGRGNITNLIGDICAQLDILHERNEAMREFVFSIDYIDEDSKQKANLSLPLYKESSTHLQNLSAIHDAIVYEVNVQANIAAKLNELFLSENIGIPL
jgi:hypothetical protein